MAIDFDDVMLERNYNGIQAYCQSKLAQIAYGMALAERLDPAEVTVNSLHPSTFMPTKMVLAERGSAEDPLERGVEATYRLVTDPSLDGVSGALLRPRGGDGAASVGAGPGNRERLVELSQELVRMSDVAERPRLLGISPRAYEHPADRAATASLATIPYLDQIVRKLIELGYERALRTALLGDSVRLGQDQLPRVWALHHEAFHVLDVEPLPPLYLTQFPFANAAASARASRSSSSTRRPSRCWTTRASARCWRTRRRTSCPTTCSTDRAGILVNATAAARRRSWRSRWPPCGSRSASGSGPRS